MAFVSSGNNRNLENFVDKLLQEKGYSYLDEGSSSKIHADTLAKLQKFLNIKLISQLPDHKLLEFQHMVKDDPDQEKVQKFISENIPNLTEVFASLLLEFRKLYLGLP